MKLNGSTCTFSVLIVDDRCIDLCLCHTQLKKTHKNGNNLFILDDLGRSPLHYAARNGKEAVVRYLVTNSTLHVLRLIMLAC